MGENDNENAPAADPAEEHMTPGGNPVNEGDSDSTEVETEIETPGGTTVTESPTESKEDGISDTI